MLNIMEVCRRENDGKKYKMYTYDGEEKLVFVNCHGELLEIENDEFSCIMSDEYALQYLVHAKYKEVN